MYWIDRTLKGFVMSLFLSPTESSNKLPSPLFFASRFMDTLWHFPIGKALTNLFFCLLSILYFLFPINFCSAAENSIATSTEDQGWVHIPTGAKSTYMGIHGGTMPVSLLVANDGSALLSFVGKTGNDFINALTNGKFAWHGIRNATVPTLNPERTQLFAGNATASLPVFNSPPGGEEWLKSLPPFGFSVSPLVIEGQPDFPEISPTIRKFRNFYLQGSLPLNK